MCIVAGGLRPGGRERLRAHKVYDNSVVILFVEWQSRATPIMVQAITLYRIKPDSEARHKLLPIEDDDRYPLYLGAWNFVDQNATLEQTPSRAIPIVRSSNREVATACNSKKGQQPSIIPGISKWLTRCSRRVTIPANSFDHRSCKNG
jgi:hypothetical protein